jgi:hypothetical protein
VRCDRNNAQRQELLQQLIADGRSPERHGSAVTVTTTRSDVVFWTRSRISDSCGTSPATLIQDSFPTSRQVAVSSISAEDTEPLDYHHPPRSKSISFKPTIAQGPTPYHSRAFPKLGWYHREDTRIKVIAVR